MPCDQVARTSVKLDVASITHLAVALKTLGLRVAISGQSLSFAGTTAAGEYVTGSYSPGRLVTSGGTLDVNAVKRAYTHAAVQDKAKKYGWKLIRQGDTYVAQKR